MLFVCQCEKKQILRRLNQNLKAQSPVEEAEEIYPPTAEPSPAPQQTQSDTEKRPSSNGDRKKWDAAELPVLPVAQRTLEETCATITSELMSYVRVDLIEYMSISIFFAVHWQSVLAATVVSKVCFLFVFFG